MKRKTVILNPNVYARLFQIVVSRREQDIRCSMSSIANELILYALQEQDAGCIRDGHA